MKCGKQAPIWLLVSSASLLTERLTVKTHLLSPNLLLTASVNERSGVPLDQLLLVSVELLWIIWNILTCTKNHLLSLTELSRGEWLTCVLLQVLNSPYS